MTKTTSQKHQKYVALIAATGLLLINFWAWSLISPLAMTYAKEFSLSPFMLSLLVAAPVMIGSLGRIPLGLLSDRYGGRKLFTVMCFLSAAVVFWLPLVDSENQLFLAAVLLGIAGASFAAGVPFVNAWFPRNQRGLALGIYALGNGGTAISGLLTPYAAEVLGRTHFFWLIAVLLTLAAVAIGLFGRESSSWRSAKGSSWHRLKQALTWKLTWRLAILYVISFGAFVALGLYLPVLLSQSYGLESKDAAMRAAGFIILATLARPLGGWLSDRLSGLVVVRACFFVLGLLAILAAVRPDLAPIGTLVYLSMAAVLGLSCGAIFAVIGHRCPPATVGVTTGVIGAAGGLGGFFPPLIMGLSFELFHSYTLALVLLAVVCLVIAFSLRKLFGYTASY
ncbi:MAG TPA: MFS transporter [Candidatus Saccharimonadales bacterium]|nr:MFS transporter [Candidatus Saccharimonadales bacterium]